MKLILNNASQLIRCFITIPDESGLQNFFRFFFLKNKYVTQLCIDFLRKTSKKILTLKFTRLINTHYITIFLFFSIVGVGYTQPRTDTIYKAYQAFKSEEIDFHSLKKVELPKAIDFQRIYHFGESEAESSLSIIFSNGKLYAKTEYSIWEKQGWEEQTDRVQIEYDNGKITIKEEEAEAEYLLYKCINNANLFLEKGTKGIGFSFNESDSNQIHQYIQFNEGSEIITKGIYPEASFVKLTEKDLEKYSKKELRIIRNEIFARNAYAFKKGGEMDKYFSQKQWYNTMRKTESPNISDIEKYNVNLITKLEKL